MSHPTPFAPPPLSYSFSLLVCQGLQGRSYSWIDGFLPLLAACPASRLEAVPDARFALSPPVPSLYLSLYLSILYTVQINGEDG